MDQLGFVGRERQLTQLQGFLDKAVAGQGQVALIAGDAGSGKTALLRQFAGQAERAQRDLVAAVGNCNAQTGAGDPYLPFREALTLLTTADVEGRVSQGSVTPENAARLRKLVSRSVQVLVEVGPDLVEVVVPGAKLLAAIGKAVANKTGWMDSLERLAKRPAGQASTASVEQARIFEQVTNVLKALAAEHPLLLVVDDLHWADSGSVALFFHLARRIQQSRILLIGTYRPYEVAQGRDGERHPLEPVINELQRYFGEITVDLGEAVRTEGRAFSDALLDSQRNLLGPGFREALYRHTGGHPLFTVELLRSLSERGALVQDERGRWIEGPTLDWSVLPARVEGVIAERLARLDGQHFNLLSVASVEGVEFTAQVVARVEQLSEREVVKALSQKLEREHGLVEEQGEVQVAGQHLWRYRFTQTLFQQYLYDALSAGERRLLHGEIASVLEALYAGEVAEIAVRLARHYDEAEEDERAVAYLIQAGDVAARVYAHPEARLHYEKALALLRALPDSADNRGLRIDTTVKLASVSILAEDPKRILERLLEVEPLARGGAEESEAAEARMRLARVLYWIGHAHYARGKPQAASEYYHQVLRLAQALGDEEWQAILLARIGQALITGGRFKQALPLLARAIGPLERCENWVEWIRCAANYGLALAAQGHPAEGRAYGTRALAQAVALNDPGAIGVSGALSAWIDFLVGDVAAMESAARQTIRAATESGNPLALFAGYGELAWAHLRLRQYDEAAASLALSRENARQVEGALILSDLFAAAEAELAFRQGRLDEAIALAGAAVTKARASSNLFAEGLTHRIWALTLAALDPPPWEVVDDHLRQSLEAMQTGGARPEVARTRAVWGALCLQRGDTAAAQEHYERAIAELEACGLPDEANRVRQRLAREERLREVK